MKKVLYILDDGKRSFTYARIAGFISAIEKADEPINLYVFRSAGLAEYEASHNCGEYNIYHLPDFSDFDGIFLDINNFHSTEKNMYGAKGANYVIRAAAASKKPVISLAKISTGFVMTDPKSGLTLNDYVEEADKLMYNDKKTKKAGRG